MGEEQGLGPVIPLARDDPEENTARYN